MPEREIGVIGQALAKVSTPAELDRALLALCPRWRAM
jgi:hypothetical protein